MNNSIFDAMSRGIRSIGSGRRKPLETFDDDYEFGRFLKRLPVRRRDERHLWDQLNDVVESTDRRTPDTAPSAIVAM